MRRIKVLHFSSESESIWPFFATIADHADRDRFEVIFCTLGPSGRLQDQVQKRGLHAFSLDCTSRRQYPEALLRLAAWLSRERVDIIETHLFDASLVGLTAAWIAGTPLKIFRGHHSHEVFLYPRRLQYIADCLSARFLSDRVIAHCRSMSESLTREEGVPQEKIGVIPLPFDFRRWGSSPQRRNPVKARYQLSNKIVFGTLARLYWVKDQATLLKAFRPIARRWPAAVLLIAGTGPDREHLVRLAEDLGISSRVVFAGYCEDIVDVMAALDVLIHPAISESFGQTVVEAFALSKPVISTRAGISPEIIADGINGLLVDASNVEAMTLAIETMLSRRSDWETMGAAGRSSVERFSAEHVIPAYEAQYQTWLQ